MLAAGSVGSAGNFDPQSLMGPSTSGLGLVKHASGPRTLHRLGSNSNNDYTKHSLPQVSMPVGSGAQGKHLLQDDTGCS